MISFSMSGGDLERHEHARSKPGFLKTHLQAASKPRLIVLKKNGSAVALDKHAATPWHHAMSADGSPVRDMKELIYVGESPKTKENYFATYAENVAPELLKTLTWEVTKGPMWLKMPRADQANLGLAMSLVQWHAKHTHCPNCGTISDASRDLGYSRRCPKCRMLQFPQIMPAVLVCVLDGKGNVILSQRRKSSNQLTILSGFMVHGESAEETVEREVEEETKAKVQSMRYIGSQTWPHPYLLMLSYYAVAANSEVLTVQQDELVKVRWVSKEEVRRAMEGKSSEMSVPGPWTAAYQILKPWVDGKINDRGEVVQSQSHL